MNAILQTKPHNFQEKVRSAPLVPGCYLYKDTRGHILYVGKAKVLRNRVKSYFNNYSRLEERIRLMIDLVQDIDYVTVDSEVEALITEANLIKKYKPKYNSMLIDDKSYIYVKFTKPKKDKTGKQLLPTIEIVRELPQGTSDYFGPFPDTRPVKRLLRRLRRLFPYCTSNIKVIMPRENTELIQTENTKPCFESQISLCNGACAGRVTKQEYLANLQNIKKFFKGEKKDLINEMERGMRKASKEYNFEHAAHLRNMLNDIKYVGTNLQLDSDTDEVAIMQQKTEKQQRALQELIEALNFSGLKVHPSFRIECYDISNIQGTNAVGSMVVFLDGKPTPENYRRFKIRMENEPNDFAMLQEVLTRRFSQHLRGFMPLRGIKPPQNSDLIEYTDNEGLTLQVKKDLLKKLKKWKPDPSFSQMPDLVIVDGGKGQLSSAFAVLETYHLASQVPIVGLAKKEEDIFKIKAQFVDKAEQLLGAKGQVLDDPFTKVHLPRRSEALYLVQRIRDEAHRFAITYHRKLRSKQLASSSSPRA